MKMELIKKFKTYLILIFITAVLSGQIVWNEPPDTIWYSNQSRWVEVILPTPQNLRANSIDTVNVILTWDEYWTQELFDAYLSKFDYDAIPNRFSLYRQNLTDDDLPLKAIPSAKCDSTRHIDTDVEFGKEYLYKMMASDKNYQTIGGLQHWSQKSNLATVTIGEQLASLEYPKDFIGHYQPNPPTIILTWNYVDQATSYIINKTYRDTITFQKINSSIILENVNVFHDGGLDFGAIYNCSIKYSIIAVKDNYYFSDWHPEITVSWEYWEDVEEYEKDRRISWFGCSKK